jgi:3-hydroxyacyl-[acyl-carrier-protein] dehydratase
MSGDPFAAILRAARRRPLWEPRSSTRETSFGRDAIERILPHRGPMLMLDAITAIDLEQRCLRAERSLPCDNPGFIGHFPGEPIYPAFLQLEILGQAGISLLHFVTRQSCEITDSCRPRRVRLVKAQHGLMLAEIVPGDHVTALARVLEDDDLLATFVVQLRREETICSTAIMEVCFVDS